jgi:ribosomal protein S18 acetylase RimI-like enzyme
VVAFLNVAEAFTVSAPFSVQQASFPSPPLAPAASQASRIASYRSTLALSAMPGRLQTAIATSNSSKSKNDKIPFLIEPLGVQPNYTVFQEIAAMCIQAFFNDGEESFNTVPFYKQWQLKSLRSLQQADLQRRRQRFRDTNVMFVARQVVAADEADYKKTPILLDLQSVENRSSLPSSADYCRGPVLGFVEVTQRPYGLGDETAELDDASKITRRKSKCYQSRAILTNLSVQKAARRSGLGSKLVERCEQYVQQDWNMREMILEVEDDNLVAERFYEKRGYNVLFEDPASRRYMVDGFWIQQVRCTRKIMRKDLVMWSLPALSAVATPSAADVNSAVTAALARMQQRWRDSICSLTNSKNATTLVQ